MSYYLANSYYNTLLDIQNNSGTQLLKFDLTNEEDMIKPLIEIDLNKRVIILPPEYDPEQGGFLSLESDHLAEYLYFVVDRYYEDMDLFQTAIVVEYINAADKPESRVFPVMLKDITTMPGKIIFAWHIGNEATKAAGTIKFAVRFYLVHPTEAKFEYNLNIQSSQSEIKKGLGHIDWEEEYADIFDPSTLEIILSGIEMARHVYWTDV